MKALSLADQVFLWMEKRQQPMHIGGLHLYDFPEDAGPKYVTELAEYMRSFDQPTSPYNLRLKSRFGQYHWEEDHLFDIDHHFRHSALPKPGRIRELLALVSIKHSVLMDRERPMWEVHLIEGLRGRRFAIYYKVHHSMMDGVAAIRMALRLLNEDKSLRNMPPLWALPLPKKEPKAVVAQQDLASSLMTLASSAGKQISTLPTLVKEVFHMVEQARHNPDYVTAFEAPPSILNQPITGSRRFAAQSYSLDRFKAIAKKMGATLNDVVLAVCSGALRKYLISQSALPAKPLIGLVPMSLRRDDSDSGNQIAMILTSLATHLEDPRERLHVIQRSIKDAKERYSQMSVEEGINFTALTLAPAAINMLTDISNRLQAFNVVISNVPGPNKPLYWNGAKLNGMYPVSIPMERIALNITLISYEDHLDFGFIACRRTLPSMQRLLDYVEDSIAELETVSGA